MKLKFISIFNLKWNIIKFENYKKENKPEKKYLYENENISELEKKELEKLDSFFDGEDKDLLNESKKIK